MNQCTHAWIAIRAIKLLEESNEVPDLVNLIKSYAQHAAIGAWIPDERDAKLGSASTQNHVFKIGTYNGKDQNRFILKKSKLLKALGNSRLTTKFIDDNREILDDQWWNTSYKATPPPGKHLANRAMALAINNIDLFILGADDVQKAVPGEISFIKNVPPDIRSSSGQIAIFMFMLSHFIADSHMPCHCDARDLNDYRNGLHKELEKHWGDKIGKDFSKENLCKTEPLDILEKSKSIDEKFKLSFNKTIPEVPNEDIWEEIVYICRGSFAISSIIANHKVYPYKPAEQGKATFKTLFSTPEGKQTLEELNRIIMHDSVLSVAMIWKNIWMKFN
jgi:hypothetical protein